MRSFRVSFVCFVYRAFASCIVRSFRVSCVRFVYRAFVSCIVRSFRISYVFRVVRVKRSFVSFAFFVRLRLVRIVNLYDPGSVGVLCSYTICSRHDITEIMSTLAFNINQSFLHWDRHTNVGVWAGWQDTIPPILLLCSKRVIVLSNKLLTVRN